MNFLTMGFNQFHRHLYTLEQACLRHVDVTRLQKCVILPCLCITIDEQPGFPLIASH